MNKPKLLDLFCGAGGCTKGYQQAGFYVVGVDINPQPRYVGDEFIQADVMEWFPAAIASGYVEQFDVIHASPPCQRFSTLGSMGSYDPDSHPDLVGPIRELLQNAGRSYVIENVQGAPLRTPVRLCGSSFGLRVRKHRNFECWPFIMTPPCQHHWQDSDPIYTVRNHGKAQPSGVCYVFGQGTGKGDDWANAMGIEWMNRKELSQAIPPAYTEYIGRKMMEMIAAP